MTEVNQVFFVMWLCYCIRVEENWILIFKYRIEKINKRTIHSIFICFSFLMEVMKMYPHTMTVSPYLHKGFFGIKSHYSEV